MLHDGNRHLLAAVDAPAAAGGLQPGMTLAQARALVPNLRVRPADPAGDLSALRQLAGWCLRYAPLVAADPPDGLWIDVTGSAHLFGGEARLLRDLHDRLSDQGLTVRAAAADTPGAAWAMARFGTDAEPTSIVPPEGAISLLATRPIEALRLPPEIATGLRLLGFDRIGQLATTPRAPLTRRFGLLPMTRLDQAFGTLPEPIEPLIPADLIQARLSFPEPLMTAEAFTVTIDRLIASVRTGLEQAGLGARRLDLLFERIDGTTQALRIGTARPSRDAAHLGRMLKERLERIDPGLGVEAMHLLAVRTDPLSPEQAEARLTEATSRERPIARLVDRLANRLGARQVYRSAPVASDVPERSVRRIEPLAPPVRTQWPPDFPRPVRLLDPPQPVDAMALLPDHPPVAFTWRRVRHRVRHADGPERIAGEWWKRDGELWSIRDYFRVEDEEGRRFWLFRRGDGADPETGDRRWFLHGFF